LFLLKNRITAVDIASARQDIRRFISDPRVLDIWSPEYFSALADKLKVVVEKVNT
jgi:hypothetical protein